MCVIIFFLMNPFYFFGKLINQIVFHLLQGNSHVIYNSSFYYHERNTSNIIKYNLITKAVDRKELPLLAHEGNNYLYTEGRDYLDLSVDENGLWAIYGLQQTNNNTVVAKVDYTTLEVTETALCNLITTCVFRKKIFALV